MESEKEQFKTQEAREKPERPPEKAERPEERITTFEKLKEWGRGVINKIRGKSQEVKTSGNETIESAVSSVKGGPEDIEAGKAAVAEVQGEIETLATESQEKVEGVVEKEAEEEPVEKSVEIVETEIVDLEKELETVKQIKKKIATTEVPTPKEISKEKAPTDLDLKSLSPEEKAKRREMIRERYREVLEKIPKVGRLLETDEQGLPIKQDISPDQLVFVNADDYAPKIDENNELKLLNANDATNGQIKRLTKHYALNHRVESNNGGGWENKPYQFIIPGEKMVESNGNPENLFPIDTFYTKSNILPEGSVIIYEQGKKPEIPEELKDKIVLIERDSDINDKELISLVIEQMGYSETKGGEVRSGKGYKNFDTSVTSLANKEGLSSTTHEFTWSGRFDDANAQIVDLQFNVAMENLLSIYKENKDTSLPDNIKEEMWQKIFEIFKVKKEDYPKLREERHDFCIEQDIQKGKTQEEAEKSFTEYFTDETISENVEKSKENIADFISQLLDGQHKIPKEKIASIFEHVPAEAWQYKIDDMKKEKSRFGNQPLYENTEELESAFNDIYQKSYQEITGKKINTENLKF